MEFDFLLIILLLMNAAALSKSRGNNEFELKEAISDAKEELLRELKQNKYAINSLNARISEFEEYRKMTDGKWICKE